MKLSKLKINPNNPQKFDDLSKLENSIREFPKMMKLRPMVVDTAGMVLGGNKRLICLQNMGFTEIPDEWVRYADELTEDEKKRFIIADNVGFGDWDWEILHSDWDSEELEEWGLEVQDDDEYFEKKTDGDVKFSEELLLEHNYIVLYFDNPLDWEVAIEKYGLQKVKSLDPAKKCQKVGIGRVIKGNKFL